MLSAYLIRHAESTANAGHATLSPESIPLTGKGHAQAQALAGALAVRPAQIVHSPFARAQQTAAPLIARHPAATVLELPVQEFTYLNTQAWAGTTAAQRWPAVAAYWNKADPDCCDGPGTESFSGLMQRAAALLQWLAAQPAQELCVVSHGIFICAALWVQRHGSAVLAARKMVEFRSFQQASAPLNVSVTHLRFASGPAVHISPTLVTLGHDMPPLAP